MARAGVVRDPHRGARFQPLLLLGAVTAYLPVSVGHPTDRAVLVGVSGAFAAASLAAWWWGRDATSIVVRSWVGMGLVTATLVAYVALLQRADVAVVDLLPFAVLLVTAIALGSSSWVRIGLQVVTVTAVAVHLAQLRMTTPDLVITVLLLAVVAGVVDVFAVDLARARSAQRRARQAAQRRSRLLTAVGRLLGHSPQRAARTTVDTLRGMGFARAEIVTDLRAEVVADLRTATVSDVTTAAVSYGPPMGDAVVDADGRCDPARACGNDAIVPIPVAGVPGGAIVVGRDDGHPLSADERDVVGVLAAQLGSAWEAEARVARQQDLLRRVTELERTRRGFLDAFSDELHAPLGGVRAAVEVLRRPSVGVDRRERDRALAALVGHTDHLGTTIAAVLDVSAVAGAAEPDGADPAADRRIVPVAVGDLLAPLAGRCESRGATPGSVVLAAPELLCHALELWVSRAAARGPATLLVDPDPEGVALRVGLVGSDSGAPTVPARSLVARLVVAAGGRWRGDDVVVLPRAPAART